MAQQQKTLTAAQSRIIGLEKQVAMLKAAVQQKFMDRLEKVAESATRKPDRFPAKEPSVPKPGPKKITLENLQDFFPKVYKPLNIPIRYDEHFYPSLTGLGNLKLISKLLGAMKKLCESGQVSFNIKTITGPFELDFLPKKIYQASVNKYRLVFEQVGGEMVFFLAFIRKNSPFGNSRN